MTTFHSNDTINHDAGAHSGGGSAFRAPAGQPEEARGRARAEATGEAGEGEETRGRGRPSGKTPAKLHAVCTFIRLTGLPDTTAAAMAGVSRSTLSRWKKEDDEVEMQLELARGQYQAPRLVKIDETKRKDGELDWRAQAWLVKFAAPEVYGKPSRRRKLSEVELDEEEKPLTPEEEEAEARAEGLRTIKQVEGEWDAFRAARERGVQGVITPGMLAMLQQRRAIYLREMQAREAAEAAQAEGASRIHETPEKHEKGEIDTTTVEGRAVTHGAAKMRADAPAEGAGRSGDVPPARPVRPCPWGARAGSAKNVTNPAENRPLPLDEDEWRACMARFGELARMSEAELNYAEGDESHLGSSEAARPWETMAG